MRCSITKNTRLFDHFPLGLLAIAIKGLHCIMPSFVSLCEGHFQRIGILVMGLQIEEFNRKQVINLDEQAIWAEFIGRSNGILER